MRGPSAPLLPCLLMLLRKEACVDPLKFLDGLSYLPGPVMVTAPYTAFLFASVKTVFTSSCVLHLEEFSVFMKP